MWTQKQKREYHRNYYRKHHTLKPKLSIEERIESNKEKAKQYYLDHREEILNKPTIKGIPRLDYQRQYRKRNIEHINKRRRERMKNDPQFKERQYQYHAQYRKRNKGKIKCRSVMTVALQSGKIKPQPCEICGTMENIEGHHENYKYPFKIRWLCRSHHGIEHQNTPETPISRF